MTRVARIVFGLLFMALPWSASAQSAITADPQIEKNINMRLATMSLDDKIGQMMQFSVDQITYENPEYAVSALKKLSKTEMASLLGKYGLSSQYDVNSIYATDGTVKMPEGGYVLYMVSQQLAKKEGFKVDEGKMQTIFGKYHIGSILNMLGGEAATPQLWNKSIRQMQKANAKVMDIPMLYGLDQVHGTTYSAGGTLFPQHIGMAATFNPILAEQMGQITAYETRACGVGWIFCPDLDLGRKPTWPRCYEGMGEDPYLASVMGLSYLKGECSGAPLGAR